MRKFSSVTVMEGRKTLHGAIGIGKVQYIPALLRAPTGGKWGK
jgi:hypothetical protein